MPIARGGTNDPENLVISCPDCNRSKGKRMPWEMDNPRLF
ncbi:HNH endonuclease [Pseudomonas luteola]